MRAERGGRVEQIGIRSEPEIEVLFARRATVSRVRFVVLAYGFGEMSLESLDAFTERLLLVFDLGFFSLLALALTSDAHLLLVCLRQFLGSARVLPALAGFAGGSRGHDPFQVDTAFVRSSCVCTKLPSIHTILDAAAFHM